MALTKVLVNDLSCSNNEAANVVCGSIKAKRSLSWFLYFSGFTANLLLVNVGLSMVWTSPVLPKLQSNDTAVNPLGRPITSTEVSVLASISSVASPIGLLVTAAISDKIGRRKTMIGLGTIAACSKSIVAFTRHIYIYYVCIFMTGISLAGGLVCVPAYNTEIAEDDNRGRMGCIMGFGVPIGILLGYVFGPLTSVQGITLIGAVPSILHLLLSTMIPDSPTYLASKGYKIEALKALEKLRRCENARAVEEEYRKIQDCSISSGLLKKSNVLDIFRNAAPRKAFLLSMEICAAQQFSGIFVLLHFMAPIFNEAYSNLSGNAVGILVGLVQISTFLVSLYSVEKFGRRCLMLFSTICCACPMFLLGLYFYFKSIEVAFVQQIRWLPIVCVIVFFIAYGLGLGPIPISLIGELFPNELRANGIAANLLIDNSVIFLTVFSFPHISDAIGQHYCFWAFSVVSVSLFIGMFFTVPETKGKSFGEIQTILAK